MSEKESGTSLLLGGPWDGERLDRTSQAEILSHLNALGVMVDVLEEDNLRLEKELAEALSVLAAMEGDLAAAEAVVEAVTKLRDELERGSVRANLNSCLLAGSKK